MSEKGEGVTGETSDGYHTFNELYEHRCLLWINLVLSAACPGSPYLKLDHFPDWDLLGAETPAGQISYHVPKKYRHYYEPYVPQRAVEFDGHTPADVVKRLAELLEPLK